MVVAAPEASEAGWVGLGATRGAIGAGLVTGARGAGLAVPAGGAGCEVICGSSRNSSESFGSSFAPMPSRSRQFRLSGPAPLLES